MPAAATRRPRSPRRVKNTPLRQRVASAPADTGMYLMEQWAALDCERYFTKLSYVIAALLNAGYVFVKINRLERVVAPADNVEDWAQEEDRELLVSSSWANWVQFGTLAVCAVNTIYFFMRTKKYLMFNQPTAPDIKTPGDNSWMIRSPHAQIVSIDVTGAVKDDDEEGAKRISRTKRWFSPWAWLDAKSAQQRTPIARRVWQLTTWNPSPGASVIFCWFGPIQVLVMECLDVRDWFTFFPMTYITAGVTYFLVSSFRGLLRDTQILSGQVLHEFSTDMFKLDAFPPPRKFDIVTRGLRNPALLTSVLLRDSAGPEAGDEAESTASVSGVLERSAVERLAQEVAGDRQLNKWFEHQKPQEWADPNEPSSGSPTPPQRRRTVAAAAVATSAAAGGTSRRENDENRAPVDVSSPEKSNENPFQQQSARRSRRRF
ncbi:Nuclear rim protein 1 [Geranomyces variabilis]|nr:Nuclear rim protein 1 [Geranomyces variabilis]